MMKMFDNTSGDLIKKNYGYRKFYLSSGFNNKVEDERKKLFSVPIIKANEDNLEKTVLDSMNNKDKKLYISYTINRGRRQFTLGSDIPTFYSFRYMPDFKTLVEETRKEFPDMSEDELRLNAKKKQRHISEQNFKEVNNGKTQKELEKEIDEQVTKEEEVLKNYTPKNELESEGIDMLGMFIYLNHNVSIAIDHEQKQIRFQDSFGDKMPENLKKILEKTCSDYKIIDECVKQQHPEDHCNCVIWTTMNLQSFVKDEPCHSGIKGDDKGYIEFIEKKKSELIEELGLLKKSDIIADEKVDSSFKKN